MFSGGDAAHPALSGATEIVPRTWHHVVLVRRGEAVSVYLDGRLEIEGRAALLPGGDERLLIGGSAGGDASFEGKLDEVAVYNRGLTAAEVAEHSRMGLPGL